MSSGDVIACCGTVMVLALDRARARRWRTDEKREKKKRINNERREEKKCLWEFLAINISIWLVSLVLDGRNDYFESIKNEYYNNVNMF